MKLRETNNKIQINVFFKDNNRNDVLILHFNI